MRCTTLKQAAVVTAAIFICALYIGCIFSKQSGSGALQAGFTVPPAAAVVLGQIPDGAGADGVMPGSGELVKSSLGAELLKRGFRVLTSGSSDQAALIAEANSKEATLVLVARR